MSEGVLEFALVRHGESVGNIGGRVLGHEMGPGLTATGRAQASAAALQLIGWGAQEVWSSDMVRARQTADAIGAACRLPVTMSSALREQNHGWLDGLGRRELVAEPIPVGRDISEVRWGGGESVADVYQRLRVFCGLVSARPARRVVVVSHGDTLCALVALLSGRGHRDVDWDARQVHGQVRFTNWSPGRPLPT